VKSVETRLKYESFEFVLEHRQQKSAVKRVSVLGLMHRCDWMNDLFIVPAHLSHTG